MSPPMVRKVRYRKTWKALGRAGTSASQVSMDSPFRANAREAGAQRRDQRTHAAAVRALDHDHIAVAKRPGDLVGKLARPLGPGPANGGRRGVEQRSRQRPGAEQ